MLHPCCMEPPELSVMTGKPTEMRDISAQREKRNNKARLNKFYKNNNML